MDALLSDLTFEGRFRTRPGVVGCMGWDWTGVMYLPTYSALEICSREVLICHSVA